MGLSFTSAKENTYFGTVGAYGGNNSLTYYYMGKYDNPAMSVTPAGTVTATKFVGSLDGTATKATKDSDGNTFSSTYLKCSGGTMTGDIYLGSSCQIIQNQSTTSNYTIPVMWYKGGTSQASYNPQIGQHNTGGDGTGSICILPYPTESSPWGGSVGLFISKNKIQLDNKMVYRGNLSTSTAPSTGTANTLHIQLL